MTDTEITTRILRRYDDARNQSIAWSGLWRELAQFAKPDRDLIGVAKTWSATPNKAAFDLFDGTAMSGNLIYAAGCMSYLTPADEPWFRFEPPKRLADAEGVKEWCANVTETTQELLAASNFYGQIHECWLEDGAFGTASIFVEEGDRSALRFTAREIGDYCLLEDHNGHVDTWFHPFTLTDRQAVQKFGEDAVAPEVLDKVKVGNGDDKREYLHCIYPREDAERDHLKLDAPNMPWASVYICVQSKKIVRKSGFWEAPEATGRHIKWGKNVYGLAPFLYALADQRQLNDLQMNLDVLAQVAAFPRIQAHATQEGEIDLRSSGVTWFKDPNHQAKEWLTGGRYDIGLDRVKERQAAVNRAFHVELFQMFAGIPVAKQMTATEVAERRREKLTLFSPTFARKTSEMLSPMLRRVFAVLLRAGAYPQVPRELIVMTTPGAAEIIDPDITYTSRIALELKAIQTSGFQRALAGFAPFASVKPEIFDNVDFDAAFRDTLRNEGVPEGWITDETDIAMIREARQRAQEAQAQQEQMAAGVELAATANKAGLVAA